MYLVSWTLLARIELCRDAPVSGEAFETLDDVKNYNTNEVEADVFDLNVMESITNNGHSDDGKV